MRKNDVIRMIAFCMGLACLSPFQVNAAAEQSIQHVFEKGGAGSYKCAYKGKVASKPCKVSVHQEHVTDPRLLAISSPGDKRSVLSIVWPDGDKSSYMQSDSGEMINLLDKNDSGYRMRGIEEGDWSRGLIIDKYDFKGGYIRIW